MCVIMDTLSDDHACMNDAFIPQTDRQTILQQLSELTQILQQPLNMKQQGKKFINLQYILDLKNYKQSFDKWMKIRHRYHPTNQQTRDQLYNKYLQVIKPIIHHFDNVVNKFSSMQYGFYCSALSSGQIDIVRKVFKVLSQFEIVTQEPANLLDNAKVDELIQKNWVQIYRLDLHSKPTNQEVQWWGQGMDIEPISIEGVVVTGKGEGRKNLGMPTANIELSAQLQKKLDGYPNGVYLVNFDFVNGQSFRGAGCLGTNPHYQNLQESRRVQVYVLHDFGDELFYGSKVVITLRRLIRFEGKFHTFDAFLQAMHNDIYIVRNLEKEKLPHSSL